ncbi:MAG: U32 family peptidase [Bacteroidales bacterium]|jgi:putative protease|nr:U32 family peptidase [Bacteroidales bacterium]
MKKIELLAPAKNLECGMEAVNNGADAVYIGADRFGARSAVGNSVQDIEKLCQYAHQYYANVFVTLNTILTDQELEEAQHLINQLYDIGVDALIVQDMGILMLDLPPIALHASTQTDNRSIEKILFLKNIGFERVILARELSLAQITEIANHTDIELEAFVYGAVCVSYSGQCYISQHCAGRSANRGACAQFCRLPYSLIDGMQNVLIRNKHLLSLQDMNRTSDLRDMIDAGITSFKIEGRLKDVNYVKNVTAWFRKQLDAVMEGKHERRASSGREIFTFHPNLDKTFHRGGSDYFLHNRRRNGYWFDTPKSIGEAVGMADTVRHDGLTIKSDHIFANGDGLCFFNADGELDGFRVNRIENGKIHPDISTPTLSSGTMLYRNHDHAFNTLLQKVKTRRKIPIDLIMEENEEGFYLTFTDEDENRVSFSVIAEKQEAVKEAEAIESTRRLFAKLGNTLFYLNHFSHYFSKPWFIPASLISQWKIRGIELLTAERNHRFDEEKKTRFRKPPKTSTQFFDNQTLDYLSNVMNGKAEAFYRFHGAREVAPAMELQTQQNAVLMQCKYCLKHALGACPKEEDPQKITEPLYLKHQHHTFELQFDCGKCEMRVIG